MGFFDRFKPSAPTPPKIADSQKDKDKTVAAAGSIYFVKWTNKNCTMTDTVKFYNEHERDIFINDCRMQGYYVSTWHESLNEQVAREVAQIKQELEQVKQEEVNRYIYQYRMAKIDLEKIRDDYESLLDEMEQEQAKKAEAKERDNFQLIECKNFAKSILRALNPAQVSEMLEALENDSDFQTLEGAAQVRLIKYYANKILKV